MSQFRWFCFGYTMAMVKCVVLFYLHCKDTHDQDELWCGCDGEGMAHIPGSDGFACADKPSADGGNK